MHGGVNIFQPRAKIADVLKRIGDVMARPRRYGSATLGVERRLLYARNKIFHGG